jgi:hypothetical protein
MMLEFMPSNSDNHVLVYHLTAFGCFLLGSAHLLLDQFLEEGL